MAKKQASKARPPKSTINQDVVDGLAAWESETSEPEAAELSAVRLDGNETSIIPFTSSMLRVDLHFLDFRDYRGYARCNGKGCLLCRIGSCFSA